jgi:uncharacterized protein YjbI with pentapeptide repeats
MEYVTNQFVEQVVNELQDGIVTLLNHHALLQITATEDIRASQTQSIPKPIADRMIITDEYWATLLQTCRSQPQLTSDYATGNLLNLLCYRRQDLSHYDFSGLTLRQADLSGSGLHQLNADLLSNEHD